MNFVLVSPVGSLLHKAVECTADTKDADFISEQLLAVIDEVGPENVEQVVTDSASNCVKAEDTVQQKHPYINVAPCAAHCLDLCLEDIDKWPHASSVADSGNTSAGCSMQTKHPDMLLAGTFSNMFTRSWGAKQQWRINCTTRNSLGHASISL
jgi:hypothetical protein